MMNFGVAIGEGHAARAAVIAGGYVWNLVGSHINGELAIIDADRRLHSLRKKPNDFVFDQWMRAFADPSSSAGKSTPSVVQTTNGTASASNRSRPPPTYSRPSGDCCA